MKAKKIFYVLVCAFALTVVLFSMTSCDLGDVIGGGVADQNAYDAALQNGYTGSFEDWQQSMVGEPGPAGSDGKSAYEIAVENGFVGTQAEWQASLIGETGPAGPAGADGADGKSAYEIAVENGFKGTQSDWLQSLVGVGIAKVEVDKSGKLIMALTDGTSVDLGKLSASCDHKYSEWGVGIEATCTSMGYEMRTCSLCGGADYRFTEALSHTFGETISLPQGDKALCISSCETCGLSKVSLEAVYSEGLEYELTEDEDAYRVEGLGTCTDTEIVIPEEYMGIPVTEIADRAFYGCATIVSVTLPLSIEKIGDKAFSECPELKNIELPDKIEIGIDVFRGSINVDLIYLHELVHVEAKEASCTEPGNIEYYYCEPCDEYYADSEGKEKLYEVLIPNSHTFIDGVCFNCGEYESNVMITSVEPIANLGLFPLGTLENAIGLPETATVYTADGLSHVLPVVWDVSDYVKNVVGDYTIKGYIQASGFYFATDDLKYVSTGVSIVDYMIGTADIVFLLDVSGSMGDEVNNVKNNIEAFAQMVADKGVSARWSAITYSDFADCAGDPREETQTILNGSNDWFTEVSEYKAAIAGFQLAYGGDDPEVSIDALLHATTLSTRTDARIFYVLLTDAGYKMDNHYDVASTDEVLDRLQEKNVNVSVITESGYYGTYSFLTEATGGVMTDIYGNFAQTLFDSLVPIIYERVEE